MGLGQNRAWYFIPMARAAGSCFYEVLSVELTRQSMLNTERALRGLGARFVRRFA